MLSDTEPTLACAAEPPLRLSGAVRLWKVDLDAFGACVPRWTERLNHAERARALRLGPVQARARFIVRRILLRSLLQRSRALPRSHCPLPECEAVGAVGGVHYAVAQRGGLALIALAARPIGLDLQRVDAVITDLLPEALAPAERAALAALPAHCTAGAAALLLASKLAYSRARRAGLDLSSLVIALGDGGASAHLCVGVAGDDPDEWTLRSLPTAPGHLAVLAVPGGADWRLEWQPLRARPAPV